MAVFIIAFVITIVIYGYLAKFIHDENKKHGG